MFDADAYLEALGPPTIKLGGQVFVGRLLSVHEWLPFEPRIEKAGRNEMTLEEVTALIKDYCDEIFPPTWRDLVNPWRKTVAEQVLQLPPSAMLQAAKDFFQCQARALRSELETTEEAEEE